MTSICIAATIAAIILLPIVVIFWVTETRRQRAKRWRSYGWSQQAIAERLGCSRTTVRRLLAT